MENSLPRTRQAGHLTLRFSTLMQARFQIRYTARRYPYYSGQKNSLCFPCLFKFINPHAESVISFARARARASEKSLQCRLSDISLICTHNKDTARGRWQ